MKPAHARPLSLLPPLLFATALLSGSSAWSHVALLPVEGKKLEIKTDASKPRKNRFLFQSDRRQDALLVQHDPTVEDFQLLVVADSGEHSELITLDRLLWKPIGKPGSGKGWKYKDKDGTRGGVGKAILKSGQLKIKAKGVDWDFAPDGTETGYAVWVRLEDEWYCSEFGGAVKKNEQGRFKAVNAAAPGACADQVCGNGVVELGEECDDGDLDDEDGCTSACEVATCFGEAYDSTFDAIQDVVLEGYGCTSDICHGAASPAGELALLDDDPDGNHAALVGVAAEAVLGTLVVPGDKQASFFYEKLAAATLGTPTTNSPMPVGGALSEDHLGAVGLWIEGGAPRDLSVLGTDELLAGCLPPADPLKIDPPEVPAAGLGLQLRSTAWALPAGGENEVCFGTWYDLTQTNLIPPDEQVDCPLEFGPNNPSDKCFLFHRKLLAQDPQSHHSIVYIYRGEHGPLDEPTPTRKWGPWTYKFDDLGDPRNGQACDPTDVDPATGYHEGCSGPTVSAVGCIGTAGPPDFSVGAFGILPEGTGLEFHVSQEPVLDQEYADGVYQILPMSGVLAWNSHAFNLTQTDTSMAQYMNLWLSGPDDREHRVTRIFAGDEIFTQVVPPFQTAEYCHTWTAPLGARIIRLSSHTHRHGVEWRTWEPPNTPCSEDAGGTDSCGPGPEDQLIYFSTEYNDPVQLYPDPPIALDSASAAERTFRFCALYDNGSTADSPEVKRISTSPQPSGIPIGGPCSASQAFCLDGPQKGQLCSGDDSFCDSAPGAGDGSCDACVLRGGVTTEDEMMVLLGDFYVE